MRPADHQSELEYVYSPPADLPEGRFEAICRLVEAGGSVGSEWIRSNLQRAYLIGYVLDQSALIACSSLKEPRPEYVASVQEQTGLDLSRYLERGYTSVRPAYRGQGIASKLLAGLTARAGERKLYSIIGEDNIGGQKIALNNKTKRVAVFVSQKSGKRLGVWIPEAMLEP
mgnify:FL=1